MSANGTHRYRIEHYTAYRYSEPVMLSHQQLHLTQRRLPDQQVHTHEIAIEPEPRARREITDAFGNPMTEIAVESAHRALIIRTVTELTVKPRSHSERCRTASWETVREALSYRPAWRPDGQVLQATQFLFESPCTRVKRDLRAYAAECLRPGRPILAGAAALMAKIHGEFRFHAGATTVSTPVMTFFRPKARRLSGFRPSHDLVPALERARGALCKRLSSHSAAAGQTAAGVRSFLVLKVRVRGRQRRICSREES